MKLLAAMVLSLASLTAQAHWETDANYVAQHCELAAAKGPMRDFTIFYRLKNQVLLHIDRVDVQWDPSVEVYTKNDTDTFRKADARSQEGREFGVIRQATHNAAFGETNIWIAATAFDLKIQLRSDNEGGSALVSFVSDGLKSKAHYRCDGVTFP